MANSDRVHSDSAHSDRADVETYLAGLPERSRAVFEELRRRVLAVVPEAGEAIKYQIPAFTRDGKAFVHVGMWKKHVGVYPVPEGDEQFARDIGPYRNDKGTARFPLDEPIPYDLVERLVALLATRHR